MKTVTIATCLKQPDLTPSDAILAQALDARGVTVRAAPWNGTFEPFATADLTLVRSTWDYFDRSRAFADWISRLEVEASVLNPPDILRWSMTKAYLFNLAEAGLPVPPLKKITPDPGSIREAMDALGLDDAIVKPLVGGTASGLSHIRRDDAAALDAAAVRLNGDGLVQAFIPEIKNRGETSFVFFDGVFSHAVLKRPKAGDIRVQEDHGGTSTPVDPPAWARDEATTILRHCPAGTAYARVDAVVFDDRILLMEVELVEPELFFTYRPETAARFADIIVAGL